MWRVFDLGVASTPKLVSLARLVQILALIVVIPGGVFWGYFSCSAFPWIVPPDHSEELLHAHVKIAMDGEWMVLVSLAQLTVAVFLPRGPFVALGVCLVSLAWLMVFQITFTPQGFPALESYCRPVTYAYIATTLLLAGVVLGEIRRRARSVDHKVSESKPMSAAKRGD